MSDICDQSDAKRTDPNGSGSNPNDRADCLGARIPGEPQPASAICRTSSEDVDDSDIMRDLTEHLFQLELSMAVQMRSVRVQLQEMQFDMNVNVQRLKERIDVLQRRVAKDERTVVDDVAWLPKPATFAPRSVGKTWQPILRAQTTVGSDFIGDPVMARLKQMERKEWQLKRDLQAMKLKADKLAQQLSARKQVAHATKLRQLRSLRKQTGEIKQIVTEIRSDLQKSDAPLTDG